MFKISYREIRSDGFKNAMSKVVGCSEFDAKTAYRIMRTTKELEKTLVESQKEWLKLASALIKKTPENRFEVKDGDFVWQDGVDPEAAKAQIEAFGAKEAIIERWKIPVDKLEKAKLTPADLAALEFMVEDSQ